MAPPILHLRDICLTFGGSPLLEQAEMAVAPNDRIGLVGRNGSGKSTLLRIAAGLVEADGGDRFVQPGITVRYLSQEPDMSGHETLLSYVQAGLGPADDPHRASYLLSQLQLGGEEHPQDVSGGEARRAALARVLAPDPDILLLDEPTNHLDLPAIEWLESELSNLRCAQVIISHDRRFLESLTRATIWIDRGRVRRLDRGFRAFETWRDDQLQQEQLDRHKLDRQIVREEDWLRYGVTARRKRNQGRLRALADLRQKRRDQRPQTGAVRLEAAQGDASGRLVIEARDLSKAFGDIQIAKNLSLRVMRGDRLALVGPNGAGKTTLIRLLTGEVPPDTGTVRLGSKLEIVRLDQSRQALGAETTLADALTGGRGDHVTVAGRSRHVVSYMKDFLFAPEQARTPIGRLSGGERGRLMLARAFAKPSNFMILDEPTNDLDLETLDLLQEVLGDYPGTVILVSHDRDFLDRVATSVLFSSGDGHWRDYAGGYSDMLAQRGSGVAASSRGAAKPGGKTGPKHSAGAGKSQTRASAEAPKRQKRKLSFKEKHALETLPARIEDLENKIEALRLRLAEPDFFSKDAKGFAEAANALEAAQKELQTHEDRWLELEALREELEGA